MRTIARLLLLFLIAGVPRVAAAQATLAGEVKDTTGAVLPGVTVEAASPALVEKVRTAVTDASGRYRIAPLPPGSTAPVVSLTSPARVACAAATRGTTATSPNNRKHLAIVRMVTSWRFVASLSYQASGGTYQRQSRLLSRVTEQVFGNVRG